VLKSGQGFCNSIYFRRTLNKNSGSTRQYNHRRFNRARQRAIA
jgi:hypothetical protein